MPSRLEQPGLARIVKSPLPWICIAAIVGGFLLGLPNLDLAPFWVDETVAVTPALSIHEHGLPTTRFELDFMPWQLERGLWDPATPLYRYAVAGFTAVFGFSEYTTRLFSLLMAVACAAALFVLVRGLYGARTGMVAAALWMASPTTLVFAREARHFTFVICLSLATLACLYASAREPAGGADPRGRGGGARVWWFVLAVALLLAQTLGYLFLPVIGAYVLANHPRRFVSRRHWPAYAAAAGVYLAVMAAFWHTLPFFHVTDCGNRGEGCEPALSYYPNVLRFFLAPMVDLYGVRLQRAWSLQHLLFAVGLVAVAADVWRRRRERAWSSLLLLWLVVPPVLLSSQEVKFPRYLFLWSGPVCALLVAVAILRIADRFGARREIAAAALAALALLSPRIVDLSDWQGTRWRPRLGVLDYVDRQVRYPDGDNVYRIRWQVSMIRANAAPGDDIVTSLDDPSLAYYLARPVHGFLDSRHTDAYFVELLDRAEAEGRAVWFIDSLPHWNHCLTDEPEPRAIDCREKYARFYARCTEVAREDAPTCRRIPLRP
jgi:4-amino-4-deoxy-L-arabinose transferase-like glycosyltransferase